MDYASQVSDFGSPDLHNANRTVLLPKYVCNKLEKLNRYFIWGGGDGSRKCHTIAWSQLCAPTHLGGLGCKDLHSFNKALIMKLGWGLIQDSEALWVRVLRNKYKCEGGIIPSVAKGNQCSELWRGICTTWKEVLKGVRWSVGDGKITKFWTDVWLPSGLVLLEACVCPLPVDVQLQTVCEYINMQGHWDASKFQHLLPSWAFAEIMGCLAPNESLGPDCPTWSCSNDGMFSTKSAYHLVIGTFGMRGDSVWKSIWRWEGPQRIRCFLWKVMHGGLITNSFKWHRGFASSDKCPLCDSFEETSLHILRDCGMVKETWRRYIHHGKSRIFFRVM